MLSKNFVKSWETVTESGVFSKSRGVAVDDAGAVDPTQNEVH